MALKSPYDLKDQIYEHLVQLSDLAIPPEELPAMYILPSLPVRHQGKRETCTVSKLKSPSVAAGLPPEYISLNVLHDTGGNQALLEWGSMIFL